MRKKLLIGALVPIIASLGLWLGSAGASAAHAARLRTASTSEVTNGPDTDNIQLQVGDQSAPDNTATAAARSHTRSARVKKAATSSDGSGESGGNSENSGETDGPGGHADATGNVSHECTGNCQE